MSQTSRDHTSKHSLINLWVEIFAMLRFVKQHLMKQKEAKNRTPPEVIASNSPCMGVEPATEGLPPEESLSIPLNYRARPRLFVILGASAICPICLPAHPVIPCLEGTTAIARCLRRQTLCPPPQSQHE